MIFNKNLWFVISNTVNYSGINTAKVSYSAPYDLWKTHGTFRTNNKKEESIGVMIYQTPKVSYFYLTIVSM